MQCPSCQFENMPGSQACARCASALDFADVEIHPPRARRSAKALRRPLIAARRAGAITIPNASSLLAQLRDNFSSFSLTPFATAPPTIKSYLQLAVPSLPQFANDQRLLGATFLALYLLCMIPALILLGTQFASILIGLAFSIHLASATSALMPLIGYGFSTRILTTVFTALTLWMLVYLPAWMLLSSVAAPISFNRAVGPIASDDVVLIARSRWLVPPTTGSWVVYTLPGGNYVDAGNPHRRETFLRIGLGQRLDRILARGGDTVQLKSGVLTVNGKPSRYQPAGGLSFPAFAVTVDPNHVFILPSTVTSVDRLDVQQILSLSIVPLDNIEGVAWARTNPLSKFGLLH